MQKACQFGLRLIVIMSTASDIIIVHKKAQEVRSDFEQDWTTLVLQDGIKVVLSFFKVRSLGKKKPLVVRRVEENDNMRSSSEYQGNIV
jgi:hypothetical protein